MRSNGIASAGGVGTVIADWIVKGRPPFDMYGLDIARCLGMHNNKRFLRDRFVKNNYHSSLYRSLFLE